MAKGKYTYMKPDEIIKAPEGVHGASLPPSALVLMDKFEEMYFKDVPLGKICKDLDIGKVVAQKMAYFCRQKLWLRQERKDIIEDIRSRYDELYYLALEEKNYRLCKEILDSMMRTTVEEQNPHALFNGANIEVNQIQNGGTNTTTQTIEIKSSDENEVNQDDV